MQHVNQTDNPIGHAPYTPPPDTASLLGLGIPLSPDPFGFSLSELVVIYTVVMESHRVEALEWIVDFLARGGQITVKGNTLHLRSTDVDRFGLLDRAEVGGVDSLALVGDDRRLGVAKKSPLRSAEEGMTLHVAGTSPGSQAAKLILRKQFPNNVFTVADTG
jgi:hypothetical protein